MSARSEWFVEWSYRLSLAFKALLGFTQLAGAVGLMLAPTGGPKAFVDWLVRNEMADDPADPLANAVMHWVAHLSSASEHFYAIYLLGHGLLNVGVAAALLFNIRGSYHVSLAVLWAFVAYQLYRFSLAHDPVLLLLTAVDLAVIGLVLLERRQQRRHHAL